MSEIKCAVCGAVAPDQLWDCGWIGVMADGTLIVRAGESDAPLVAAPSGGSCLVCGEICLQLLVWRETSSYLATSEANVQSSGFAVIK